jgi:hypothetical protein
MILVTKKFDLGSPLEAGLKTEIEVYFDLEVYLDDTGGISTELQPHGQSQCGIYIGGRAIVDDFPFSDLSPETKAAIDEQIKKLSYTDFGLTEADLQTEIEEIASSESPVD